MMRKNQAEIEKLRSIAIDCTKSDREQVLQIVTGLGYHGPAAEIGTFNGTFANEILDKTAISKLFCVDPYKSYDEFRDAINVMDMEMIFQQAQRFLSRFSTRVVFIREFSVDAAKGFGNRSLDLVYIDGNHQSEFVRKDLEAWWPKVRLGGLIIGDDCVDLDDTLRNDRGDITLVHRKNADGSPELYGDYGVHNAVHQFCSSGNLDFELIGTQFLLPVPSKEQE